MSLEIAQIPQRGSFFKPETFESADALLIVVERFEHQRPTPNYGPKDTAIATITVFKEGTEPAVHNSVQIQQSILARDLEALVGKATIVKLDKGNKKPGQQAPWVWREVTPELQAKVVEYVRAKEAEVEAAKADAPDFD